MAEEFRIRKIGFIAIASSIFIAAFALSDAVPDPNPFFSDIAEAIDGLSEIPQIMTLLTVMIYGAIILTFPFSAFLANWVSAVFTIYYLHTDPLEAILLIVILGILGFLNRLEKINIANINLLLSMFIIAIVIGITQLISEFDLIKEVMAKATILLPTLYVMSIRHGDASRSRFQGADTQYFSATQKNRMATVSQIGWWEILRPYVENIGINIYKSYDDILAVVDIRNLFREQSQRQSKTQENKSNINLASLKKIDKQFQEKAFLSTTSKVFKSVQSARYNQKIEWVQSFVSDALYQQFRCRIEEQQTAGIKYDYNNLSIDSISIGSIDSSGNFDEIQVLISSSAKESLIDLKTKRNIYSAKSRKFHEYWSFVRQASARTLEKKSSIDGNCPSCSASLQIEQATVCSSCGSYIRSGLYDWVLAKITQVCEWSWSYSNPSIIPSWGNLKKEDPEFNFYQLEDLAGVIFWMLRLAERNRKLEPIFRFSSSNMLETIKKGLGSKTGAYMYYENVAIVSINLKGVVIEPENNKLYVLVVWSGIPINMGINRKIQEHIRYNESIRDIMVLSRKSGEKTISNNTLTNAHCHNCGGNLELSFSTQCGFCGSSLIDDKKWHLEKLLKEDSPEYEEILRKKAIITNEEFKKNVIIGQAKVIEENKSVETVSGRDIVTAMIQIMFADGVVDEDETRFIKEIATKYHMPDEILTGIIESVKNSDPNIPKLQNAKPVEIMNGIIQMAYADGVITPEEEATINNIGKTLGYTDSDIKRLFKVGTNIYRKSEIAKKHQELKKKNM